MASGRLMLLSAAMLVIAAPSCDRTTSPAADATTIEAVIGGQRFRMELAMDDSSRYRGLSDRDQLDADAAMLFVFPSPRETAFAMRRCRFPIDLLLIGPGGRVDRTHRMTVEPADKGEAELKRYPSAGRVQFAIEFVGGTLDRLGLEPGQRIDLPFEALKRRAR